MPEIVSEKNFEDKKEAMSIEGSLEKKREKLLQALENNPEAKAGFAEVEESYREKIKELQEKIESSYLDHGTGLENRNQFYRKASAEAEKYLQQEKMENDCEFFRYGGDEFSGFIATENGGLAVIMGDLAYLNRFNDVGGHAGGDLALKSTAEMLNKSREKMDYNGNIGEISQNLIQAIGENSQKVEFPSQYKDMELSLNLGYATMEESEEIYAELGLNLDGKEKIAKLTDIMVKIADRRMEMAKARDRVWLLCRMAGPMAEFYKIDELVKAKEREIMDLVEKEKYEDANKLTNEKKELKDKKSALEQEHREDLKEFEEMLKFSLKGMAGVRKSDLLALAGIKDEKERFEKIRETVEANIDARNRAQAEQAEQEIHHIHEMAKKRPPALKYGAE